MKVNITISLILALLMVSCANAKKSKNSNEDMKQGITGTIIWEEGNQMPMIIPDDVEPTEKENKPKGIKRTLLIHELTKMVGSNSENGFHSKPATKEIARIESDSLGRFKVSLLPGKYSLFVLEERGYYANLSDGQQNIFPVEVKENEFTQVEFVINYKAVY